MWSTREPLSRLDYDSSSSPNPWMQRAVSKRFITEIWTRIEKLVISYGSMKDQIQFTSTFIMWETDRLSSPVDVSRDIKEQEVSQHLLALVRVWVERMLVRLLGIPALARDTWCCLVDFTAVILAASTETVGGKDGALTFLHANFRWAEETDKKEGIRLMVSWCELSVQVSAFHFVFVLLI